MTEKKNVRIRLFKDNSRYKAWRWKCRPKWPRCWSTARCRMS